MSAGRKGGWGWGGVDGILGVLHSTSDSGEKMIQLRGITSSSCVVVYLRICIGVLVILCICVFVLHFSNSGEKMIQLGATLIRSGKSDIPTVHFHLTPL